MPWPKRLYDGAPDYHSCFFLCPICISLSLHPNHTSLLPIHQKLPTLGNSLAVQWLGHRAFTAEGMGSIPGWGDKIQQATRPKKDRKSVV